MAAAAAALAAFELAEFNAALTICGADALERNVFTNREQMNRLIDSTDYTAEDINNISIESSQRSGAAKIIFPQKVIINVKTLCF